MKRQPIGVDDFKTIIDLNLCFTDKTLFIKDIIDDGSGVILIARPRRFGKTLNMSLLRYYFGKSDVDHCYLFKNFKIWQQGDHYLNEFGRYPVISLTLKDLKANHWALNYEKLCLTLSSLYCDYPYLLKSDVLQGSDKEMFQSIFDGKATRPMYEKALSLLCKTLSLYHGEKVVILLDEYDALLNESYIHGFFEDAIAFMRPFLSETFKNNIYLRKGVLTGIFRVAMESIFSDMNNLKVSTLLSDDYREYFGFTEDEVRQMLLESEISEKIENVASWYNGYIFGETKPITIYNPWSIIMYLDNKTLKPYWINTSGNAIIRKLAIESNPHVQLSIQTLIEGGGLRTH
ncbi:MAG: AAA family ATPase [Vallitaleaceae bacterium]|nr:AAA family ATPase [Vallitaleaceae bacterium]